MNKRASLPLANVVSPVIEHSGILVALKKSVQPRPALIPTRSCSAHRHGGCLRRTPKLLENGDGIGFGKLMNESQEISRQNFENSTPELDLLVSIAQNLPGVLGARLTSGGFGGATVTLCERLCAKRIAAELSRRYADATGIAPHVFVSQIADGAK